MRYLGFFLLGTVMIFIGGLTEWASCTESNGGMTVADSDKEVLICDSSSIPLIPEPTSQLLERSDVIAYSVVEKVSTKIEGGASGPSQREVMTIYPEQHFTATLLWVLKGDSVSPNTTIAVVKRESRYFVSEREKRVLYLKKTDGLFQTVDRFGGEQRLAFALCEIRNQKKAAENGGIVASFQGDSPSSQPIVHVLKGRQKRPLQINGEAWKRSLLKNAPINQFDICEIPLAKGTYTVLLEMDGVLFSHTRAVNGYYACVNIGEYRWWEPLSFVP
jgi:hypothetical protein